MSTKTPDSTPTEVETPPEVFEKKKKRRTELEIRLNRPLRRGWRIFTKTWYLILLAILVIGSWISPDFMAMVFYLAGQAGRILSAIGFVLIQFVAIFWFMSRSKVEVITPEDAKAFSFDDYHGQPRLLELVRQWISLLEDRSQFKEMGGEYINGLLLYGAPGTGKTLLAKCMAGESDIAFISIEGSGFKAMFWGVDVLKMISFISKARKLAREYGACIAFIDEIDAVGASRGGVMGGGNATMGAGGAGGMMSGGSGALTRLLYEMDGVGEMTRFERIQGRIYKLLKKDIPQRDWHVLFMGSTNRPDVLDPALTRPGRFDRTIEVALPDRAGRKAIINYYISKIKTDDSIDVDAIVADTTGYTPAQIMSAITKDAVRMAVFDNRKKVSQRDIDLAFQEQAMGLENPIEDMPEIQRKQIAYHEAGHAVGVYYLMPELRIVRATIIRRSNAYGYVHSATNYEFDISPLNVFVRRTMVSLGGDVATKIWGGEAWTGTAGDFKHVRMHIQSLAMNGYFGPPLQDPATFALQIEKGNQKFINFWKQAESATEKMLREHWEEVDAIANALLDKGDLTGKEITEIIQEITGETIRESEDEVVDELIAKGAKNAEVPSGNGNKMPKKKSAAKKTKAKATAKKKKAKKKVEEPAGD